MLEQPEGSFRIEDGTQPKKWNTAKQITTLQQLFQTYKFDGLDSWSIYGYGLGHFLNDLAASFWFNFSLFFLVTVAKTQAAAITFLVGQIVDSLCTPLAGFLSDKFSSRLGQRTPWYLFGYVIVIATFPFIFRVVNYGRIGQLIYYPTFAGLFNVGWAFVQINHMSLVPSVSCSKSRRTILNNYRNTAAFIANFILLSLSTVFFSTNRNHQGYFFIISLILVAVGSITTFFFIYNFRQTKLTQKCLQYREQLLQIAYNNDLKPQNDNDLKWYSWFKKPTFYFYGFAYVCARLSINIMVTMLPFYIKKTNHSTDHDITIALLVLYMASILTSAKTKDIMNIVGRHQILVFGFVLSILASGILQGASNTGQQKMFLFLATGVIGVGQAILLNTVLDFICDIIGSNGKKGGFVFGVYSFMDKITTGLAVYFVSSSKKGLDNMQYIKILILLLPPSLTLLSCVMSCLAMPKKQQKQNNQPSKTLLQEQLI